MTDFDPTLGEATELSAPEKAALAALAEEVLEFRERVARLTGNTEKPGKRHGEDAHESSDPLERALAAPARAEAEQTRRAEAAEARADRAEATLKRVRAVGHWVMLEFGIGTHRDIAWGAYATWQAVNQALGDRS